MSTLPSHARTVVVGGGAVGCSVAYHLAREGRRDVVLLERSRLTSGTTWHAAGLVRRLRPSATLTRLIDHSIELYRALEAETGQATGWIETGSLSLATHPDRLTHLARQVSLGRAFGLESEVVDAARARALWPLLDVSDVVGAVWSPGDGRVSPSDVAAALAKGARARGVRIHEETPVTGLERDGTAIAAVVTPAGRIACEEVVLACGLWSREVAALAGADVPLYACEHYYLLTRPVPGIEGHLPTLNDQDHHLYARDEVGGLLVGCFEPDARPLPLDALPRDFSFDLLEEDWEHFTPTLEHAMRRIPALATAEARMLLVGPESFTLDGQFLIGESPQVDRLYVLAGMNSTGIALAGGAGRALAEWMVAGEPTLDLLDADLRRFPAALNVLGLLHERIPEVLGRHYEIAYPGRAPRTARGQRRSPLHEALARAGARFEPLRGWERPAWFDESPRDADPPLTFGVPPWREAVGREHRAALEGVALFDLSAYAKVLVQGPDAEAFLGRLCANDVAVAPGRVVYTAMTNRRGGIELDLTVQRHGAGEFLLVAGTGVETRLTAWLRRHRRDGEAVTWTDVTAGWAILGLAGPRAGAVLAAASRALRPVIGRFRFAPVEVGLARAHAARLSYTGEDGYEIHVPGDVAPAAHEALAAAGVADGLHHAGAFAMASLRIEAGFRSWGHELTPAVTPWEAGLGRFVALEKPGGLVGREALLEARRRPPRRRVVSLLLDDPAAIPLGDEPVWHRGRVAGQITSAAWGYRFGRSVALALVEDGDLGGRLEAAPVVAGLEVEIAGERFAARASLRPPRAAFGEPAP